MSRPWLRLYTDVLHNAKAHRLNDAEYRTWIGLLAAFRANDDVMPSNADLAFSLRRPERKVAEHIERLITLGLMERTEDGLCPHNWDERQFLSDTSKERTREYRNRHKRPSQPVTSDNVVTSQTRHRDGGGDNIVTAQERAGADSETYSETEQSRAETEKPAKQPAPRAVVVLPDWLPGVSWAAFLEHRKRLRKPLTPHACDLVIAKLGNLRANGHDPCTLIDTAIERGWQSVFEPTAPKPTGITKEQARTAHNLAVYQQVTGDYGHESIG